VQEPPPPLPDDVPEDIALVVEDCLAKDPAQRPPNARAVALRLGLGDHEMLGLGLGLAWYVNESDHVSPADLEPEPGDTAVLGMP
jgi:serine/threonine-protein kinase